MHAEPCFKVSIRGETLEVDKFRDPIHGFIEVRSLEKRIIDSPPFQRLRNIKQLAMTYYVYHGAEHTRFGHSLGVMHLVTKAFNATVMNAGGYFQEAKRKRYEQILRLIALTHDLGHAPFSHAAEAVFPEGKEHEDFTEELIMNTEIAGGGVQAFEEFVLARYFMFLQVYFHRTRRFLDIMLGQALKAVLPNGRFPEEINEYLKFDDGVVLQLIKEGVDKNEACYNIVIG